MTPPDVEQIIEELKRRVIERRAAGDYPVGLEAELEAEFKAILALTHRGRDQIEVLRDKTEALSMSIKRVTGVSPTKSRLPGGQAVHRVISKLTRRQVAGLADQFRQALADVESILASIVDQLEEQRLSDDRQMNKLANSVLDRIVVVDQLAVMVVELERRLNEQNDQRGS